MKSVHVHVLLRTSAIITDLLLVYDLQRALLRDEGQHDFSRNKIRT